MRRIALYPGTFDPVTLGHVDIAMRAAGIFENLTVGVADNPEKSTLFSVEERMEMLRDSLKQMDRVSVTTFQGLTAKFAKSIGAVAIIRGLRAVSDFEFEFQMGMMNRRIEPEVETVFLMPKEKYSYISSSLVKDIAKRGGDISPFVPPIVKDSLAKKYAV